MNKAILETDKMTRNSTASNSFGSGSGSHELRRGKKSLKTRVLLGGKIVENPTMFEEIEDMLPLKSNKKARFYATLRGFDG